MNTEKADLNSLRIERTRHSENPSPRRRSYIAPILTVLVLAGAVWAGRSLWDSFFRPPIEVDAVIASLRSPSEQQSILSGSGYVVAQRKAAVASKATGLLVELNVKEGDKVRQNQVLARLQDNDIKALLAEAEGNLALGQADLVEAENNLERQKKLAAQGTNTDVDVERAEAALHRVRAAISIGKARVEGARVALENTIIRAPFDGTVLTKNADVGEIVAPFAAGASARAAVVSIADLGSLQVEADVSESNIQKISLGGRCEVRLDAYPNASYPGSVASIIPTADRSKGTVMVKIGFDKYDERVLPEMSAKVTFLKEAKADSIARPPVLVVPESSVVMREGRQIVFKIIEDNVVETPVQPGDKFNGFLEIRNGLKEGDRVVRTVPENLTNGLKVKL